ncbi:MAG: agmatine deiminase family protein [Bacteroidales bacterium]|nr:agmatine deiminase family protein [Bacteroidales bacterium]
MKKLLYFLTFAYFFLNSFNSHSQEVLPNYLTEEERALLPFYTPPGSSSKGISTPPSSPVRSVAEWEEMDAVVISWKGYTSFLTEIVRNAVDEVDVYIYTTSPTTTNNTLVSAGVDVTNVHYLNVATNSVWIRDFGPNNVYSEEVGELYFVDWVYNRSRPDDDDSPQDIADELGVTLYESTVAPTDLVNTGGNFMSDGFGTAFASVLVLEENEAVTAFNSTPKTEAEVDQIVSDFMGISRYIKMETLPYDGIHHIDMHMKLLDEETLLVGEYPAGVSDGPQIEANIQYIQNNFMSVFGTPYRIIRIPMPPDNSGDYPSTGSDYLTYTNSVILNKTILVPIYGLSLDDEALQIYRDAMPGYNVVGIDANSPITASGAIHCTTHEIATNDPLLISHQRLRDVDASVAQYEVEAYIKHLSGIQSATVYYKNTFASAFSNSVSMTASTGDYWSCFIPGHSPGDSIYYYIEANAVSGKTQVRPMTAPYGYWAFKVVEPAIPVADFSASSTSIVIGESISFTDLSTNFPTSWLWNFPGGSPASSTEQFPTGITYNTPGTYEVSLTATNAEGSDTETKSAYITVSTVSYCISTYTQGGSEYISNVQFNTINNSSGDDPDNGYTDFTSVSTELTRGETYTLSVTINTAGNYTDHCQVFFDWNVNGSFYETNEMVDLGQITNVTAGVLSGDVTVPVDAELSATRMRINIEYNGNPGPCEVDHNEEWGETEDYTVEVISATPLVPVANFSTVSTSVCVGNNVSFSNSSANADSWQWTFDGGSPSSSTEENPTVIYNTPGTYSVSLIASNSSFSDTETKTNYIVVTSPPNLSATAVDVNCFGENDGSVDLTVSGGTAPFSYLWNPSASSQDLSNIEAGTYSVTVSDASSCTATTSVTVNQPATALSLSGDFTNAECGENNGSAFVFPSGGTSPYSYLWSNGSTTSIITNLAVGNYTVTVSDNNDCETVSSYYIDQPQSPVLDTVLVVDEEYFDACNGSATANISGGNPPYSYLWSNDQTTETATNLCSGNYSLTITDSLGCSVTGTFVVSFSNVITENEISDFILYPNPSSGIVRIEFSGIETTELIITDLLGKVVYTSEIYSGKTNIDLKKFNSGIYFVSLNYSDRKYIKKLILTL